MGYANGGWNDIEKVRAFQYEPGKVYELKILVCGNQFKVYVDGQQYYEFTDDKFPYGSVGLRSWNQPFEAGYFKVRRLTAVSYTHLDVYKRQGYKGSGIFTHDKAAFSTLKPGRWYVKVLAMNGRCV